MNNIWKFSLLLAFSIIIDQLCKGSAQSLVTTVGDFSYINEHLAFTRLRNEVFILGFNPGLSFKWANRLALLFNIGAIFYSLYWIVIYRHRNVLRGWSLTLLVSGLFSSWLDRQSSGFTLDYISVMNNSAPIISFSLADVFFALGLIGLGFSFMKRIKS